MDLRSDVRVFLNHRREPLTRFGVRYILAKHLDRARADVATSLANVFTLTACATAQPWPFCGLVSTLVTISQWLGHASPNTTNRYATTRSGNETQSNCSSLSRSQTE